MGISDRPDTLSSNPGEAGIRKVGLGGRERGFSQEGLAFECRLHRTYISGVERGVRNPTVTVVEKIARALEVPASRLLDEVGGKKQSVIRLSDGLGEATGLLWAGERVSGLGGGTTMLQSELAAAALEQLEAMLIVLIEDAYEVAVASARGGRRSSGAHSSSAEDWG